MKLFRVISMVLHCNRCNSRVKPVSNCLLGCVSTRGKYIYNQQVTRYETEKLSKLCHCIFFYFFPSMNLLIIANKTAEMTHKTRKYLNDIAQLAVETRKFTFAYLCLSFSKYSVKLEQQQQTKREDNLKQSHTFDVRDVVGHVTIF